MLHTVCDRCHRLIYEDFRLRLPFLILYCEDLLRLYYAKWIVGTNISGVKGPDNDDVRQHLFILY